MYTYQFLYVYDCKKQIFKVVSDIDSYNITELSWDYIEEYDIYNIKLKDLSKMKICINPITGIEYTEEIKIP